MAAADMWPAFTWRDLPDLPQALGGQFVGVVDDRIVVAGGSFWTRAPWSGGTKSWSDAVYVLTRHDNQWRLAGKLPEAMGYGCAVTTPSGMLLIGGQTSNSVSDRIYGLRFENGRLQTEGLSHLPHPMMTEGGALAGDTVYLAGGQSTAAPTQALTSFLSARVADLENRRAVWKQLPLWPGPARFLPQMAAAGGSIYLVGGSDLVGSVRHFLSDAYEFTPDKGWRKLHNFPQPAQAGTAAASHGRLCIFGGSDGTLAPFETLLKEDHPGFSRMAWTYDPARDQWIPAARMPVSLVTTGIAAWGGELVIAGGEDRPAHRSARVVAAKPR